MLHVHTSLQSYTHSALDNLLLKLRDCGVDDMLRLGSINSTHPAIKPFNGKLVDVCAVFVCIG